MVPFFLILRSRDMAWRREFPGKALSSQNEKNDKLKKMSTTYTIRKISKNDAEDFQANVVDFQPNSRKSTSKRDLAFFRHSKPTFSADVLLGPDLETETKISKN